MPKRLCAYEGAAGILWLCPHMPPAWVEVFEFFRHFIDLVFGDEQRCFIDGNHTFTHSLAIQVKLPSQFGKVEIYRRKKYSGESYLENLKMDVWTLHPKG